MMPHGSRLPHRYRPERRNLWHDSFQVVPPAVADPQVFRALLADAADEANPEAGLVGAGWLGWRGETPRFFAPITGQGSPRVPNFTLPNLLSRNI